MRFWQEIQTVPRQTVVRLLNVVAGILHDESGRVLITERVEDGPFKGLWEFPGGKIADFESPERALARELAEEIGVEPVTSESFMRLRHDYPDRHVSIEFFLVSQWSNEPRGLEGQQLRWVETGSIEEELLLPADAPVIEALKQQFC